MPQSLLFPDAKPLVERLGKKFFLRLPRQPGVYKMRDAQDKIVYVGKAKNLRQRLTSYRIASPERMPRRHLRMLRDVIRIELQLCPTETSALKQEARLIRELKPKFNRAGVWQGKPRFLAWRFADQSVEFAIQETPLASWRRIGPLGSWAPRLRAALVRLIWVSVNSRNGFAGMPRGWARGDLHEPVTIDCGNRIDEVLNAMENHFPLNPDDFAGWLRFALPEPVSGFDRKAMLADLEVIQEFAAQQKERASDPAQIPLL